MNMFIVLSLMEYIVLCHVFAIVHFCIVMGRAIDALHNAVIKIKDDGSLFMDEHFKKSIFSKIEEEVPKLTKHLEWMNERKEMDSTCKNHSRTLLYDLLNTELFYPQGNKNI